MRQSQKRVWRPILRASAFLLVGLSFFYYSDLEATCQTADPPAPQSRGPYSLSGTVSNSVSGVPISRALVQLAGGSEQSTLTDLEGHFRFAELPASEITLSARKPGFFSEQEVAQGSAAVAGQQVLHLGADSPAVLLKLTPESIISGHIGSGGEPVEGVPVKLISPRIREGRKVWEPSGYATPDEEGNFRISGLLPGIYYVAVGPSTSMLRIDTQASGYSEVFYPGVSDIGSATPFDLPAGQQVEADFSLKREPVFQVSGTISAPAPVRGVNLQFTNSLGDAGSFPYRYDPVSGGYISSVTAGTYTLRASAFDNGQVGVAERPLNVNSNLTGVALSLAPAASIPVLVSSDFVTPQGKRMAALGLPGLSLQFISSDSQLDSARYWAVPKDAGTQQTLSFENIQPGRYVTEINPQGSVYVASAKCGNTDLLREDLAVSAGGGVPPVEIVLRDDGAALDISLTDTQAKATVLLVPDRVPRQIRHGFYSGQLRFEGLAPGEYSVLAFDNADGLEYENPEVLSLYLGDAERVTLSTGQNSSLTLRAIHLGK
jgi:Carboxypeptidase regulatory-like domain